MYEKVCKESDKAEIQKAALTKFEKGGSLLKKCAKRFGTSSTRRRHFKFTYFLYYKPNN